MPSVPSFPNGRATAKRPPAMRDAPYFDSFEEANITLAATTNFQEVITFGGRPDRLTVTTSGSVVDIRIRDRGAGPGRITRFIASSVADLWTPGEIVEARDSTGAGGQLVVARGYYASRQIDRREHVGGPFLNHVHEHADQAAEQVERR
jgi:hypothetical protein